MLLPQKHWISHIFPRTDHFQLSVGISGAVPGITLDAGRIEIVIQAKVARSRTFCWIYIAICFECIRGANWTQFPAIVPIPPDVISAHLCLTDWSWCCWLVGEPPWTGQLWSVITERTQGGKIRSYSDSSSVDPCNISPSVDTHYSQLTHYSGYPSLSNDEQLWSLEHC